MSPAEERRVVTILFADVSGFTAMSETLDPEDVRSVMNECFGLLSAEIYRQGGVVDKYTGDNVMAVFGLPKAREDDPARAVRAALAMQESLREFSVRLEKRLGRGLKMRIGLNTGLVVAGDVGSREKSAFTVMGDAVNLASRIEHHCRPGEVWASRSTALAAQSRFTVERLEPIEVKGKRQPQVFFRVVGARDVEEVGAFAGRGRELEVLRRALSETLEGRLQIVTISGEAGSGKTRLLREFMKETEPLLKSKGGRILQVAAMPGGNCLYGLFAPLSDELGFELPREGGPSKSACCCAVEKALQKSCLREPLLLVLEDLHFADAGSLDILSALLKSLRDAPMMILCLYRPEAERSLLWSCAECRVELVLGPLEPKDRLRVVEEFLGPNQLPLELKEELSRRSGGNPYFLTELLRNLVESDGIGRGLTGWTVKAGIDFPLPESVSGAVLARLDRLAARERLTVEVASCLGLEFEIAMLADSEPAVGEKVGEAAHELALRRFLEPRADGVHAFLHALIQEACYSSVLKERRRIYHRRIGALWEARGDDPHGRHLMRSADHYYLSREPGKALALNWRAGERAERAFAGDQALVYYRRTAELLEEQAGGERPSAMDGGGPSRALVLYKLGEMYSWTFDPDRSLECYQEAISLLGGSDPLLIEVYRKAAIAYNIRGEPHRAEGMFVKAGAALAGRPVSRQTLGLYYEIATAFFRSGRNETAREWIDRIIAHYREQGIALPVTEDADIYRLIPAFSELAAPG